VHERDEGPNVEGLTGRFEHSLDGKGRVVLPARFRPAFAAGGFLTRGKLGAIELFPPDAYAAMKRKLRDKVDEDDEDLKAHRKYRQFTSADEVQLDVQGRIPVSSSLQQYAQLVPQGKVVVVGADRTVELWHPDLWESQIALPGEDDLFRPRLVTTEDS
jgi:MraZ protein